MKSVKSADLTVRVSLYHRVCLVLFQIYVLLVNKEGEDSRPVVVRVPPPAEVAEAMKEAEKEEKEEAKKAEQMQPTRRSGG